MTVCATRLSESDSLERRYVPPCITASASRSRQEQQGFLSNISAAHLDLSLSGHWISATVQQSIRRVSYSWVELERHLYCPVIARWLWGIPSEELANAPPLVYTLAIRRLPVTKDKI